MMRLRLSLVLTLLVFAFPLSAQKIQANGSQGKDLKSSQSSPGDGSQQQNPSGKEKQAPKQEPTYPPQKTENQQSSTAIKKDAAHDETFKTSRHECDPLPSGTCAEWASVVVTGLAAVAALITLGLLWCQVKANRDAAGAALEEATAITQQAEI